MKSKDFVISKIDMLVKSFPSIQCRYEFEENEDTHTIQVSPISFFESNETFKDLEKEIYLEFFRLYPFEGLYFIDDNSLFPVLNPIYIKTGAAYFNDKLFNSQQINTIQQVPIPHLKSIDSLNNIYSNINVQQVDCLYQIENSSLSTDLMAQLINSGLITKADNTSYALAA